mgnify:CR=1 FL=1
MIKRLIFHKVNKRQLAILTLGTLIGFLFLLSVVHYFGEVQKLTAGKESISSNLVIAQKRVTKYAAFDSDFNLFTNAELQKLREHPAIKKMEPVVNNQFYVSLAMREDGLPYFRTDIFIQSVNNDLLDVRLDDWQWSEDSDLIPMIMPRDFMLMLNQFAASYKIPQVSEEIAKTLNFTLEIRGIGKKTSSNARIVGFSNQINAVLVPMDFMTYGNVNYAAVDSIPVSQLVLQLDERKYGDFEALIEELNLEIKENELYVVQIQAVLFAVLGALFLVGLVIIGLCGLLILQFSMLLLSESNYEVQTLLRLGYDAKSIAKLFMHYFLKRFALLLLLTIPLFMLLKWRVNSTLAERGLPVSDPLHFEPYTVFGLLLIFLVSGSITYLNYQSVKKRMMATM